MPEPSPGLATAKRKPNLRGDWLGARGVRPRASGLQTPNATGRGRPTRGGELPGLARRRCQSAILGPGVLLGRLELLDLGRPGEHVILKRNIFGL